jgi:hypothetical protein
MKKKALKNIGYEVTLENEDDTPPDMNVVLGVEPYGVEGEESQMDLMEWHMDDEIQR